MVVVHLQLRIMLQLVLLQPPVLSQVHQQYAKVVPLPIQKVFPAEHGRAMQLVLRLSMRQERFMEFRPEQRISLIQFLQVAVPLLLRRLLL